MAQPPAAGVAAAWAHEAIRPAQPLQVVGSGHAAFDGAGDPGISRVVDRLMQDTIDWLAVHVDGYRCCGLSHDGHECRTGRT